MSDNIYSHALKRSQLTSSCRIEDEGGNVLAEWEGPLEVTFDWEKSDIDVVVPDQFKSLWGPGKTLIQCWGG